MSTRASPNPPEGIPRSTRSKYFIQQSSELLTLPVPKSSDGRLSSHRVMGLHHYDAINVLCFAFQKVIAMNTLAHEL